jgi:hypothetical protein
LILLAEGAAPACLVCLLLVEKRVWSERPTEDALDVVGEVNQIGPNERGDDWQFEIAFEPHAQAVPRPGLLIDEADVGMWPRFHPQDSVRIRTSGLSGSVQYGRARERRKDYWCWWPD